jgi:hypothetical protein
VAVRASHGGPRNRSSTCGAHATLCGRPCPAKNTWVSFPEDIGHQMGYYRGASNWFYDDIVAAGYLTGSGDNPKLTDRGSDRTGPVGRSLT